MDTTELKNVLDKQGAELKGAIEKYEGQLRTQGAVADEAKQAVVALSQRFESAMDDLGKKMAIAGQGESAALSAGDQLVATEAFKALAGGMSQGSARVEVKNTVLSSSTTTGYPDNRPGIVPGIAKPLTIRDVLPSGSTSAIMVVGTREASYTNAAAETAQGAAKPESAVTFEQFNTPIETVATWIKVSKQLLSDAPSVVSYINGRLFYMLDERIDLQLLKGTGVTPNLGGLQKTGNFTAFTATSGANLIGSINKAKYDLWAKGYTPDAVILNPADWAAIELARESGATGAYLYGAPGTVASTNPFGVRVVLSSNQTAGQMTIGAFNRAAMVWNREGAVVEAGFVADDFTKNLVTLRAECRLGLEVSVPGAILHGAITAA